MNGFCHACFGIAAVLASHEPAAAQSLYMPPADFIRPFPGKVTVMNLPHKEGNPMLSLSSRVVPGQCVMWLPKVGDPGITSKLRDCLWQIELANCNGAADVNTPAVRSRMSARELARYRRTDCQ